MSDISKEFLDELQNEFNKRYLSNKKIRSLTNKLTDGTATAENAFEFAKEVGNIRKLALHDLITDDILNDGYLGYYNALDIFSRALLDNYEIINNYCKTTFTQVNRNAGIGLNGVSVEYNQEETDGIVECAVKDRYTITRDETEEAVVTNAKKYYDKSVKKNFEFQGNSGLNPVIIRTAVGKTCKWCQSLAGVYDYLGDWDDFIYDNLFRRHSNCDCVVVYSPKKGKYQDVWSKKWENGKYKRIEYNFNYSDNVETNRKRTKPEIAYQDKKATKKIKNDFKGYNPAKLVSGSESGCNMRFESNGNGTYRVVREIVNTSIPAGNDHVELNNSALANSFHERGHDVINCLAIKRAGVRYENMVSIEQITAIENEYLKIQEELFVAAFPDDMYKNISIQEIFETIGSQISFRATHKDELAPEVFVKINDKNKTDVAERVYNYIKEEWNK